MAQISLRVPDDLLEQIEEAAGPETARSEWIRNAARLRLEEDRDLEARVDLLEERVDDLEAQSDRPLWSQLFR